MEHELPGVLDGVDEPATVEELEAVVRRAGQRRRASLVAGAVGLLTLGALAGALVRGPVAGDPPGFAGEPDAPSAPVPAMAMARQHGPLPGWTLTPLFRRETNGVAIRAYRSSLAPSAITVPETPVDPACLPPTSMIRAELSNGAAVAVAEAPEKRGDDLGLLGAGDFGRQEGEAAIWAVVRAPAGAAAVRLKVGQGIDTMAPVGGIAVLTVPGGGADGTVDGLNGATVEGLAADGKVLATSSLTAMEPLFGQECAPPPCFTGPSPGGAVPAPPAGAPNAVPPLTAAPVPPPPTVPGTTLAPPPPSAASRSAVVTGDHAVCGGAGYPGGPSPMTSSVGREAPSTSMIPPTTIPTSTPGEGSPTTTAAPLPPPPSTAPPGTAP